jgi:hypothetical protein
MATEETKKDNLLRMTELSLETLAVEVWDTLGESSKVMARGMGDELLTMLVKENHLDLASKAHLGAKDSAAIDSHMDAGLEIGRVFVDELGFAKKITFENDPWVKTVVSIHECINTQFTDKMLADGLKENYTCPFMLTVSSAMAKLGMKGRVSIERWPEGKGCKIIFTNQES